MGDTNLSEIYGSTPLVHTMLKLPILKFALKNSFYSFKS